MLVSNHIEKKEVAGVLARIGEKIGDALFPPQCVACHAAIDHQYAFVCQKCFDAIELNTALYCPICMGRIGDMRHPCHRDAGYLLAPATFYRDPIPALIHHFKYKKLIRIQLLASALLITYLKRLNLPLEDFVFVPIPLHPARQRERGFNQALLIAELCATYFRRPLVMALTRVVKTKQQASLTQTQQRYKNVANAFALNPSACVRGKKIILVDDVSTSGATLAAAAHMLKSTGARTVIGAVVAKAQ
jgi:ComF family protein